MNAAIPPADPPNAAGPPPESHPVTEGNEKPQEARRTLGRAVRRRLVFRTRLRQGGWRVRVAFWPIVQASLAAGIAYLIARYGLGHTAPFFAPVCAWVCLGFSQDRELRRTVEVAVGVAIGVGLGDLVVHFIGSGWWQVSVVLAASTLAARFIDRGVLLTVQAGVQSLVIVGLPALGTAGPLGRWIDALVGGAIALAVVVLTPGDPRRRSRGLGAHAIRELAVTVDLLAAGLRSHEAHDVEAGLLRARSAEPSFEEWLTAARSAREVARMNAVGRRHLAELGLLERQAVVGDRAMNGLRVIARRALAVVGGDHDLAALADLMEQFGNAAEVLAEAIGASRDLAVAREYLLAAAQLADPHVLGNGDWQVQSLVVLLRSPIVDMLEAAGADPQAARDALPVL